MSYCRFSEGDVYMYPHVDGGIRCCGCLLNEPNDDHDPHFDHPEHALEHLYAHERSGHKVPSRAYNRLREEVEELTANERV